MATIDDISVSVALCTYNGEQYIGEQLRSILHQTETPSEIVVSDDNSQDATLLIVNETFERWRYLHRDAEIRLVVVRNDRALGVTANFESAASLCSGDLIALSDQDDVWQPDRLAQGIARFREAPGVDLVFADARLVDANGFSLGVSLFDALEISPETVAELRGPRALGRLLRRNLATGATVMFRRNLLDRARPFPSSWVHDEWLTLVAAATGRLDVIEDQLIDYRQHGRNAIGVKAPTLPYKIRRVLEPRLDRNRNLAEKFAVFATWAANRRDLLEPSYSELAEEKAAVEAFREALPAARLARVPRIAVAIRKGWYNRFTSRGGLDVLRDLLQSHALPAIDQ